MSFVKTRHAMNHERAGWMVWRRPVLPWLLCCVVCTICSSQVGAEDARSIEFNRDVRPLLSENCFACHGPDASHREAELRLDVEESAKGDRDGSFAIVPGDLGKSGLVARITSDDPDMRMPPADSGKELTERQIKLLKQWIAQGAKYQPHWSFIPPKRPAIPQVRDSSWPAGDIDHFILARLAKESLMPSPDADPVAFIRRLHFDLTGLPPTADEVNSFLKDCGQAAIGIPQSAIDHAVARLLASPHFGERMAIYWLDLVRYADSVGYHGDQEHNAAPYRDWVIKAFNDNLPFDEFTTWQLAGDLLEGSTAEQKIASCYNRLLQTSHEGGVQQKEYLAKYSADRVRSVSGVWLGATMGCAECHDHKYDPYTQKDFYSLAAFFADVDDSKTFRGTNANPTKREPEIDVISPLDRWQAEQLQQRAQKLEQQLQQLGSSQNTAEQDLAKNLPSRIKQLRDEAQSLLARQGRVMITVSVKPREIRVLKRGDWMDDSGEIVAPSTPHFLPPMGVEKRRATRLDLARWLTSPRNPQTARVFVNRLWYLLHGVGLSKSLDDTGSQGERPTHPQLLDWLAVELVESGWDIKHIVRLMVSSRTYRQSSLASDAQQEHDPENRLFARQSRFRLPAETIRDNALAVSGLLVDRLGGPSARPYQPEGYYAHLNFPTRRYQSDKTASQYRRGVYVHWQRMFLHPMLRAFDAPTREECTAQRSESNTPLQMLVLLNDPTFVECSRVFAERILREGAEGQRGKEGGGDGAKERKGEEEATTARIRWAWRQALSREPGEAEVKLLSNLYQKQLAHYHENPDAAKQLVSVGLAPQPQDMKLDELAAWTFVARAIFTLNETITRN